MRRRLRPVVFAAWWGGISLAAGCPGGDLPSLPITDGAVDSETPWDPFADLDGDGLCNGTEAARGTDERLADTDGDGLIDSVEVLLGYDPVLPHSPGAEYMHRLSAAAGSETAVLVEATVSGQGESYRGGFEAALAPGVSDATAADYYAGASAHFADPSQNVGRIESEAELFEFVDGPTTLFFELRFAVGEAPARPCAKAHAFRYQVKRSDGVIVSSRRHVLVLAPADTGLTAAEWCDVPNPCI